jgi:MoxR-like ATPase
MCLQAPLQNQPYLIKRLGKVIHPQPGFNICATANTKGQGNETGKFIGTNVMNEAMLDRYVNFFHQEYPPVEVEKEILTKLFGKLGLKTQKDALFIERLLQWSETLRESHKAGVISEFITTRRLVHIGYSYKMYGRDRLKAIKCAIARFQEHVVASFLESYTLVDDDWAAKEAEAERVARAMSQGLDPETVFA